METKKIINTNTIRGGKEEYEVNHLGHYHGLYKSWHPNGNKMEECTYQNGEYHGPYKAWRENGDPIKECVYKKGKIYGLYKTWWFDGTISSIETKNKSQTFGTRIDFVHKFEQQLILNIN